MNAISCIIKTQLQNIQNNIKGFTLLEVAIAVLILTIGLLGISGLMISVIKTNKTSAEMSKATTLAQSKMEEIRRLGYLGAGQSGSIATEAYGTIPDYPAFQRITSVSAVAGTPNIKSVAVTVSWQYQGTHFVELKSILSRQ